MAESFGRYTQICNVLVTYWVSWEGGLLAAGYGHTVGANKMIVWQDPSPSFQVNSVDVYGSAVNVTWSIPNRYYLTGKTKHNFLHSAVYIGLWKILSYFIF